MQTVDADRPALTTGGATTAKAPTCPEQQAMSQRRHMTRWLRIGLIAGLVAVLALNYRSIAKAATDAIVQTVGASTGWLALAAGLAVSSMIAFGLLRRRTVIAAGGTLSFREAVAVSYAAGAIHLTTPGGVVLSTAYLFRRLQRHRVPPAAIAWSVTVSGVLSTVTLVTLGVAGFAAGHTSDALQAFFPVVAMAVIVTIAVITLVRRADIVTRLVVRGLRAVNSALRRPKDAGVLTAHALMADLRAIRPTSLDWITATGAAAANWLLDLLCLWACARAIGIDIAPWLLMTSFALAMAGAGISPLPGGVGVVDGVLVLALAAGAHVQVGTAIGAVLLYRVISLGSLLVSGWFSIGIQSLRAPSLTRRAPAPTPAPVPTCIPALH